MSRSFRLVKEIWNMHDFRVIEFALFGAILSAHQSRERIVGCGRAGRRPECPRAVARVLAGSRALDRRCAEGWESPHALPCQMRPAVLFPNPFYTPQLNTESKPNCHVALSRIPRSMIAVDENLCVHSPIVPNRFDRVSEVGDEYGGDRAHLMSVLLPPDQREKCRITSRHPVQRPPRCLNWGTSNQRHNRTMPKKCNPG